MSWYIGIGLLNESWNQERSKERVYVWVAESLIHFFAHPFVSFVSHTVRNAPAQILVAIIQKVFCISQSPGVKPPEKVVTLTPLSVAHASAPLFPTLFRSHTPYIIYAKLQQAHLFDLHGSRSHRTPAVHPPRHAGHQPLPRQSDSQRRGREGEPPQRDPP